MNNELGEQSIAEQRIIEDLIYEHARVARDIVQIDAQTWSIHEIEPFTDGECLVCSYCDWINISDELGATFTSPVVPVDRLQRSVENLERIATRAVVAAGHPKARWACTMSVAAAIRTASRSRSRARVGSSCPP